MEKNMNKEDLERISKLEKNINYIFRNKEYALNAITHKSYAYENNTKYNERLEFLGDSILGFVIAETLYKSDKIDEGIMSKERAYIVCEDSLYEIAQKLDIEDILRYGGGLKNIPPKAVLADCIEAIIAAIYLDSNMKNIKKIILRLFKTKIMEAHVEKTITDYKSMLQEIVQKASKKYKLEYISVGETGPDHDKTFEVWLKIDGKKMASGYGKTKKSAEMEAARITIEKLEKIEGWKNDI